MDQLSFYVKNAEEQYTYFQQYNKELETERAKALQILQDKGKDEAAKYQNDTVFPLQFKTGNLYLNARFFTIGALSLRRYVAGRLYLLVKSRYLAAPDDPAYAAFLSRFKDLLALFEQLVTPRLSGEDI
jgi:hypothetical protein